MFEPRNTYDQTAAITDVNGINIHTNEAGSGPVLFGFHGGGPGPTPGTTRSTTSTRCRSTSRSSLWICPATATRRRTRRRMKARHWTAPMRGWFGSSWMSAAR